MTTPSSAEEPWPVRVVAKKISDWIARLGSVWVEGQVAQLSLRPRTAFLTLRDPAADISLSVTCSREVIDRLRPPLREGARVVVLSRPDYYVARGQLSLRASDIRPVGIGELLARLERLKQLMAAEGLFDPARKRRLPFLPNTVGLITGRASAAERDVLENARRRWPMVRFKILNCAVQGPGSAGEVIGAMKRLDGDPDVDVIVIARGGGSVEDLLPFSDEALCRAVVASRTPVISAIGHEPDTPLLDYVADVRCSTPTDAGKRVVPDVVDELAKVDAVRNRARRVITGRIEREYARIDTLRARPIFADPHSLVEDREAGVHALRDRARRTLRHRLEVAAGDLEHTRARVTALSPAATLARGYAVVQRADGSVVRAAAEVETGERLGVRLAEGHLDVVVTEPPPASPGT